MEIGSVSQQTDHPAVRLVRPMQMEYITVGYVLRNLAYDFYSMTEKQFVLMCMEKSNGSMNPQRCQAIYKQLMDEAGIKPKFKCPINFEGCTQYCGSYGCGG